MTQQRRSRGGGVVKDQVFARSDHVIDAAQLELIGAAPGVRCGEMHESGIFLFAETAVEILKREGFEKSKLFSFIGSLGIRCELFVIDRLRTVDLEAGFLYVSVIRVSRRKLFQVLVCSPFASGSGSHLRLAHQTIDFVESDHRFRVIPCQFFHRVKTRLQLSVIAEARLPLPVQFSQQFEKVHGFHTVSELCLIRSLFIRHLTLSVDPVLFFPRNLLSLFFLRTVSALLQRLSVYLFF